MFFENKGHKVSAARNIHEGHKILKTKRIDLLVTDYSMPDGTGNILLQGPRRAQINILISGFPFSKTEWQKFGFDAYFLKPCEHRALLEVVNNFLKKLTARNKYNKSTCAR